jgi:hypothetical protein
VFKLLQLEISGYDIKSREIGAAHHLRERTLLAVVADRTVESLIILNIKFGLQPEQRRKEHLGIKINSERAIAA